MNGLSAFIESDGVNDNSLVNLNNTNIINSSLGLHNNKCTQFHFNQDENDIIDLDIKEKIIISENTNEACI